MGKRSGSRLIRTIAVAGAAALAGLAVYGYRDPGRAVRQAGGWAMWVRGAASRLVLVDGRMVHYYATGPEHTRESPLLLLHGVGASAATWWRVMPRLARALRGRRIVAVDYPGFGKSEMRPAGVTVDDGVVFLTHFMDALGIDRAVLIGNSLGGWIVMRTAARHPERVSQVITVNGAGLFHGYRGKLTPHSRAEARRIAATMIARPLPMPGFLWDAMMRNARTPAFKSFVRQYDPDRDDLDHDLAQIQAPTTIIWGNEDRLLPAESPDWLAAGIPHAKIVRMAQASHASPLEAPGPVTRAILRAVTPDQLPNGETEAPRAGDGKP